MSARYSLNRKDRKLAGVCSTIGAIFNIDPTFVRIGFAAFALMISWEMALIAYVGAGIYFHMQKRRANSIIDRPSDFDRMGESGKGRTSLHDIRTTLDTTDRRMMAIDQHLATQNDELAREIEALRQEKQ